MREVHESKCELDCFPTRSSEDHHLPQPERVTSSDSYVHLHSRITWFHCRRELQVSRIKPPAASYGTDRKLAAAPNVKCDGQRCSN